MNQPLPCESTELNDPHAPQFSCIAATVSLEVHNVSTGPWLRLCIGLKKEKMGHLR